MENPTEFAILKVKGEKGGLEKLGGPALVKSKSEQSARDKTLLYISNQFRHRIRKAWFYRKRGM